MREYVDKEKNMRNKNTYYEIDIVQLLGTLWRKAWVILLAALIGGGVAFTYAAFLVTPLYKAEAQMYVNNSSFAVGSTSFSINSTELTAAQSLVDTYIVILNSRPTLEAVLDKTGVDYSCDQLENMISAGAVNNTEIFSITVTSKDPQEAELIANAIVDILPDKISDVVDGSSVRTVEWAIVPSEKSSPDITMYTAIGGLVGVVIACMILIIQFAGDTLIHDEDYLTETYKLPVLAVIPNLYDDRQNSYYKAYRSKERKEEQSDADKKK